MDVNGGNAEKSRSSPDHIWLRTEVFTIGEVAQILAIPQTRVKNWTIGRPLWIIPTVRMAAGKGSRNLYSIRDVYAIAVANHLIEDGFTTDAIRRLLGLDWWKEGGLGPLLRKNIFITANRREGWLAPTFHIGLTSWRDCARREKGAVSKYILDVGSLMRLVDKKAAKLRRRRK
ncbi:MAG TPA: MerR family transcriptional regulator [Terriglobia bacterium]|nr:MerR family transcriptional regulator [Terriglobia bacterium]